MGNILNHVNNFNLVIYTNRESYIVIEQLIESNKINSKLKVIFKEWDEFYTYKWNSEWIINHEKNDLLNNKSSFKTDWKLNMLWNEKVFFVHEAIDNQYFNSEWYGWCDIGYFRNSNTINWPNPNKINNLNKNKIYYGLVCNINVLEQLVGIVLNKNEINMPKVPIPTDQVSIAGGFFITHKSSLKWWKDTYYSRLNEYFKNNYLVKDDQIIIIDCIINNLIQFELVHEVDPTKDEWFVFQNFLI
jgi:hypothetical protein